MAKHKNHQCRFNDGEQTCTCYDAGYDDRAKKLVTLMRKAEQSGWTLSRFIRAYAKANGIK